MKSQMELVTLKKKKRELFSVFHHLNSNWVRRDLNPRLYAYQAYTLTY